MFTWIHSIFEPIGIAMNRRFRSSLPAVATVIGMIAMTPASSLAKANRSVAALSQQERARILYLRAEEQFVAGHYQSALDDYDKAFRITNLRGFLLIVGHCHARMGNVGEATKYYRFYLHRAPRDDKHRASVESAIAALTGKLAPSTDEPPPRSRVAVTLVETRSPAVPPKPIRPQDAAITAAPRFAPMPNLSLVDAPADSLALRSSSTDSRDTNEGGSRWLWPAVGAVLLAAGATWFVLGRDGNSDTREGSLGTLSR